MSEFSQRFHASFERRARRIEEHNSIDVFTDIGEMCESEIEKYLAVELIDLFCPTIQIDTLFISIPYRENHNLIELENCKAFFETWLNDTGCMLIYGPRTRAVIFPQVRIVKMRVDFVVMAADEIHGPRRSIAAIECDGHDFHERTKEQAARDRRRDRALTASGIPFFRFTGSEIWKDAHACMREVENFLWREMVGRDFTLRQYDQDA